jgi:hypothetical protein
LSALMMHLNDANHLAGLDSGLRQNDGDVGD